MIRYFGLHRLHSLFTTAASAWRPLLTGMFLAATPAAIMLSVVEDAGAAQIFRLPGSDINLFSDEEEAEFGDMEAEATNTELRLIEDPAMLNYLNRVGRELAGYSSRPDREYRFYLVDSREANAFALPGGHIYVSTGMLDLIENESELAGILSHEIAHVAGRHGMQSISRAILVEQTVAPLEAAAGIASATLSGLLAQVRETGTQLVEIQYTREQESDADRLGLHMLADAGWNPHGMVAILRKLDASEGEWSFDFGILNDHPSMESRALRLEREIPALGLPDGIDRNEAAFTEFKDRLARRRVR